MTQKKGKTALELYYEMAKTGKMPERGLCNTVCTHLPLRYHKYFFTYRSKGLLKNPLFKPSAEEILGLSMTERLSSVYWAYEPRPVGVLADKELDNLRHDFTPLRQNLYLLMLAMEGDL